jgi:hypothetical protein
MALDDGGPPAMLGMDAPDQGVSQGPSGRWAILVGDQFQHGPPRLTARSGLSGVRSPASGETQHIPRICTGTAEWECGLAVSHGGEGVWWREVREEWSGGRVRV